MFPFAVTLISTYIVLGLCGLALAFQLTNAGLTLPVDPLRAPDHCGSGCWDRSRNISGITRRSGHARFSSDITWQNLFTLYLGNLGLLLVTLGWAWPWVTVRNARFSLGPCRLRAPWISIASCRTPPSRQ